MPIRLCVGRNWWRHDIKILYVSLVRGKGVHWWLPPSTDLQCVTLTCSLLLVWASSWINIRVVSYLGRYDAQGHGNENDGFIVIAIACRLSFASEILFRTSFWTIALMMTISHACINAQKIHTAKTYGRPRMLILIFSVHICTTLNFKYWPCCFTLWKQQRYVQLIWSISSQFFSML